MQVPADVRIPSPQAAATQRRRRGEAHACSRRRATTSSGLAETDRGTDRARKAPEHGAGAPRFGRGEAAQRVHAAGVDLAGRQRLLAHPFAITAAQATDFRVTGSLDGGGRSTLLGSVAVTDTPLDGGTLVVSSDSNVRRRTAASTWAPG
jgi:hypothetical protein